MNELRVPQHFKYIVPIIEILKELGGSGRPSEVTDLVVERLNIPEEELSVKNKSGVSRIENQIHWAKFILVKTDYMDSSQRGVWDLTDKGRQAQLTEQNLLELYKIRKQMNKKYREAAKDKQKDIISDTITGDAEADKEFEQSDYRNDLLGILQSLPPAGFERICQRLLREANFEQVTVIGQTGNGGIDGIGILQVNPFVSFKVLFQCKRYQGSVSPSQIRDFRGAMQGRTDKGIIITTGTFTSEVKKEARRDGVPPIELVDGEKLIDMFEYIELGLKPIKTYEIDDKFFEKFKN